MRAAPTRKQQKGRGLSFPFFSPSRRATRCGLGGQSPGTGFFPGVCRADGTAVDKDSREALQVAKELTAKFIETRTVSPGNFAEIFPAVYNVVARAIAQSAMPAPGADNDPAAEADASAAAPRGEGARKTPRRGAGERG